MNELTIKNENAQSLSKLSKSVQTINRFVKREYLYDLSNKAVVSPPDIKIENIRFHKIEKLVIDPDEDINNKLTSIYNAVQNTNSTMITLIKGTRTGTEFYIGIRSHEDVCGIADQVLKNSFIANFPGSELNNFDNESIKTLLGNLKCNQISSASVIPSLRKEDDKNYIQGIEKFIDTMSGLEYSAMLISSPVSKLDLDYRRTGLEQLSTSLSPLVKTSLAYGKNQSQAITEGTSTNISKTLSQNISDTIGHSKNFTKGESWQAGVFKNGSKNISESESFSTSETIGSGSSDTTGSGTNKSFSVTLGASQTTTTEIVNKTAEDLVKYIDEQLEKVKTLESFGGWETAAYFMSASYGNVVTAASTFKALVAGDDTNIEGAHINTWDSDNKYTQDVAKHLKLCSHPEFLIPYKNKKQTAQVVTAGNLISGKDLPIFLGLPQKSVAGLSVTNTAEFSRNISFREAPNTFSEKFKELGCIHHKGKDETNNKVKLNLESLTSHCFITGSTGSGKSNTTSYLLETLIEENIPFLVVEPAKGEYKTEFGGLNNINIFTTNPKFGAMLKINPFEFNPNIHVLEHLDRLIEIFNACWEMYAAMPAILKNAVEKAYINKGWDLQNSIYLNDGPAQFPTFEDVLNTLPKIIENSGYSSDTQGDYTGALTTRVESLTNGITGQIFCDNYFIKDEVLFDESTIIDLSRIGSNETKSLIMGILVMRLNEYRMANAIGSNKNLRHVTVLEESHNLLKNVTHAQGQQTANPVGKSVEMICNSIAEMRTYGEGFFIVDQSPYAVDIAAIKNTNTKIVMKLPEKQDCEAIGSSLGLNEAQIQELSKLPTGVAAVLQNGWLDCVLCKINKASGVYKQEQKETSFEQLKKLRSRVVELLLVQYSSQQSDIEKTCAYIDETDVSNAIKQEFKHRADYIVQNFNNPEQFYLALLHLSGLKNTLMSKSDDILGKEDKTKDVAQWKTNIINQIYKVFDFENENIYEYLLHCCVYAMRWQASKIDFIKLYKTIKRI